MIAHELPSILVNDERAVSIEYLEGIHRLVSKIDKWWIYEIEIPTNPDFDPVEFTDENLSNVRSLRMEIVALLIQVAKGNDAQWAELYRQVD